jgi:hypothetical protein
MPIDVDQFIEELRNTVRQAYLNYEIWWTYKSQDTRPTYIDMMNRYSLYFQVSIHAHFVAALIALYRLYETRPDTYNIPRLLERLGEHEDFPSDVLENLNELYQAVHPIWVKVCILRNKAFGHHEIEMTIEDVFAQADVKPDEFVELIENTKLLLNRLSGAWNRSGHAFNLSSREDTLNLLNDLNSLHEQRT